MTAKATSVKSTFRMQCSVRAQINAPREKIWRLLTDTAAQGRWNSTLKSIEGNITQGGTVKLESMSSPGRTFKLKVSSFTPNSSMTWEDGFAPMFKGVRTFMLKDNSNGTTDFVMTEVFSGLMLPMIKGSLPDFVPIFEQYANDLKNEAEKN